MRTGDCLWSVTGGVLSSIFLPGGSVRKNSFLSSTDRRISLSGHHETKLFPSVMPECVSPSYDITDCLSMWGKTLPEKNRQRTFLNCGIYLFSEMSSSVSRIARVLARLYEFMPTWISNFGYRPIWLLQNKCFHFLLLTQPLCALTA